MILEVFVPLVETHHIAKGSAIVGQLQEDGLYYTHYEGGIYGGFETYNHLLLQASGRYERNYPTVAKAWFTPDALERIGEYDTVSQVFTLDSFEAQESLEYWLADTKYEFHYTSVYSDAMNAELKRGSAHN